MSRLRRFSLDVVKFVSYFLSGDADADLMSDSLVSLVLSRSVVLAELSSEETSRDNI